MRRRDAQSRCPELEVLAVDPSRDARLFEPIVAAVEAIAPGVEVLRPGMVACSAKGSARYFGSEHAVAERIVDAVESLDVECRIGIADILPVAVLAARQSCIVGIGGSAEFCASLPIAELARDPAIAPPERAQLVDLLVRLGIHTAGAFAALPPEKVATRFGPDGTVTHLLARGLAERGLSRRRIDADLSVEQECDPPLDRVDTAAFAARALAERFHARLASAGLACTRLSITATTESGACLTRVWRCARPLTAAATADRLRWQLDGWLTRSALYRNQHAVTTEITTTTTTTTTATTTAATAATPTAIVRLRLEPVEAVGAGLVQYGLWGSDGQEDHRAGWAFARIQGLLGPESVLAPILSGGRTPIERITLLPWGEEQVPDRDPHAPWPGGLPAPSPTFLTDPGSREQVAVIDADANAIVVTDRGLLTGAPTTVAGSTVTAWAGPWLFDERWWATPSSVRARIQVITDTGPPMLLGFGHDGWRVEGVFD
jgi:protein ImuB